MKTKKKVTKPAPKRKPTPKVSKKKSLKSSAPARSGKSAKRPAAKAKAKGVKRNVRTAKRPSPRPKARSKPVQRAIAEAPEALALARTIRAVAEDKKASDVVIIDMRAKASAVGYDYLVVATGESDRQLGALAEAVADHLKPHGRRGSLEVAPDWVCADYGDVIAHFFTPDARGERDLEGMWSDAPRVS